MSSDGKQALEKYLSQSGRSPETPSQRPSSIPASVAPVQVSTSSQVKSTLPVSNSKNRINPRTGSLLSKKVIPGTTIEIDYDPATGGVFLDSGELEALSRVPDIKAKLEMLLTP
jgi:hypothetical protein